MIAECTCEVEAETDSANYSVKYHIDYCPLHAAAPLLLAALEAVADNLEVNNISGHLRLPQEVLEQIPKALNQARGAE